MITPFAPLFVALGLAFLPGTVRAADMTEPAPAAEAQPDPLAMARAHIEGRRWPAAIGALRQVNATGDPDWNNLMGYALRKQTPPDLDGAQRHYDAALKINPRHRGALEYAGELALMKGNLATAEAHLATLGRLCRSPCEALDDLRRAVDAYKAGKR
jgi:Flp pilus assembly protein TadD